MCARETKQQTLIQLYQPSPEADVLAKIGFDTAENEPSKICETRVRNCLFSPKKEIIFAAKKGIFAARRRREVGVSIISKDTSE